MTVISIHPSIETVRMWHDTSSAHLLNLNTLTQCSQMDTTFRKYSKHVPWQLLAVWLVLTGEVVVGLGLLVRWRSERGGWLVTVGGGWRGSVVPLRGRRSVLAAFHQVCSLREGWTPFLIRSRYTVKQITAQRGRGQLYTSMCCIIIVEGQPVYSVIPSNRTC